MAVSRGAGPLWRQKEEQSLWSGPSRSGDGIPEQKGGVDVASCTSGFEQAFSCICPLKREGGWGTRGTASRLGSVADLLHGLVKATFPLWALVSLCVTWG